MAADLSVIMPLYNCEPWVEGAVRSVLENADGLRELIVIDDGSTDRSPEIVAGIEGPIELIRQPNGGPSAARNAGIRAARGDVIGFLDADDIWAAGAPDARRELLAGGFECAIGKMQIFSGDPPVLVKDPGYAVLLGTMLLTRELAARVGEFDETMLHGEDVDWVMRMRELGVEPGRTEQVVLNYRLLREGSLTSDRENNRGALTGVIHKSLARRRLIGGDA